MGIPGKQVPSTDDHYRSGASDEDHDEDAGLDDTAALDADDFSGTQAHDTRFLSETLSGDQELNQQTSCSNCQTVFEVSMELLASSDTRVRCGECLSIFDALANLRDAQGLGDDDLLVDADGNIIEPGSPLSAHAEPDAESAMNSNSYHEMSNLQDAGAAALAGLSNDTSSLDVTYSDFDLFSGDAALPEVAYLDQTVNASGFDFDDLTDVEDDETFSDSLFAQDVTVDARTTLERQKEASSEVSDDIALDSNVDYISNDNPREPLIFNYRERETRSAADTVTQEIPEKADAPSPVAESVPVPQQISINPEQKASSSWWLRSVLLLLVLLLAAALYGYRERNSLQNSSVVRPVLESVCGVIGCTLNERVDLNALKVLKRSVFSHPSIDNALIINIEFVNEAGFGQRYPILEIRLTDRNGRLVVRNNFQPDTYLKSWQSGDVLDDGKRLAISLNVQDPGQSAMSFELDFR